MSEAVTRALATAMKMNDTTLSYEYILDTYYYKMNNYISQNTKYPDEAKRNGINDSVPGLYGLDQNREIYAIRISPSIIGGTEADNPLLFIINPRQ